MSNGPRNTPEILVLSALVAHLDAVGVMDAKAFGEILRRNCGDPRASDNPALAAVRVFAEALVNERRPALTAIDGGKSD